jgi:hypothetical protein
VKTWSGFVVSDIGVEKSPPMRRPATRHQTASMTEQPTRWGKDTVATWDSLLQNASCVFVCVCAKVTDSCLAPPKRGQAVRGRRFRSQVVSPSQHG